MNKESFRHYKTGIDSIDQQHWELFELLTALKHAMKANDCSLAKHCLTSFFKALDEHCEFEEALMYSSGYKFAKSHAQQHPESTFKLLKYQDIQLTECLHIDVARMRDLLKDHIDHADIQFGEFYRTKEIQQN